MPFHPSDSNGVREGLKDCQKISNFNRFQTWLWIWSCIGRSVKKRSTLSRKIKRLLYQSTGLKQSKIQKTFTYSNHNYGAKISKPRQRWRLYNTPAEKWCQSKSVSDEKNYISSYFQLHSPIFNENAFYWNACPIFSTSFYGNSSRWTE